MQKNTDGALLVIRLMLAVILLYHGLPKIVDYEGTVAFMQGLGAPLPPVSAVFATIVEVAGGILLVLGLWTELVGLLVTVNMAGAIFLLHLPNGFNFFYNGIEHPLTVIAMALALVLAGPGRHGIRGAAGR